MMFWEDLMVELRGMTPLGQLLYRTPLKISFEQFLDSVEDTYPVVGHSVRYSPILEGYESANILWETTKGKYVIKIFEKDKQRKSIDSMIRVLQEAPKVGVPVTKLVSGVEGDLSIFFENDGTQIPYYLTEFFDGQSFDQQAPSIEEISDITEFISRLNTLDFPVVETYDSWGNKNLIKEYEKVESFISKDIKDKAEPVVDEMRGIDLSSFSQSVIHGDMQLKHVLKNKSGEYCILDFGCMSYDAKVIDLSTYLAWFCLSESHWEDKKRIMEVVVGTYMKAHFLTQAELSSLPALIRAAYASYFLKTSQLIADGDMSKETKEWNNSSEIMLKLAGDL